MKNVLGDKCRNPPGYRMSRHQTDGRCSDVPLCPFRVSLGAFAVGDSGRAVGGHLLMPTLGSIVILLPVKFHSGLCCTMTLVVVRVQVLAGRRERFMSQVVPHVSRIDLVVHHARARRVPQPMGRRLAQPFRCTLVRFAGRLQMSNRVVEHLFND